MQCEEFEIRLNEVLDERRRPESDAELSLHRETCPVCRKVAAAYDRLLDGFYALASPEAPDDMGLRVVAEMRSRPSPRRRFVVASSALAIAAALLIAIVPMFRQFGASQSGDSLVARGGGNPAASQTAVPSALTRIPRLMPELLAITESPDGDPYAGLAKETGQGLATVMLYVPGVGGGRGIIDAPADQVPWAAQVGEGLRPITNSVTETFDVLLEGLPVSQLAARS